MTAGGCSSSTEPASSNGAVSSTTAHGTPALTVPGLVAPPRSRRAVFTGPAAEVERAFRARLAAYDRKDVGYAVATQATKSSRREIAEFMNTYQIRLFRITRIDVFGDRATVDYEDAIVGRNLKPAAITTLLAQQDRWTKQDGRWKTASDRAFTPGIPEDLTTVALTLRDHARIVVPRLPRTDFAFLLKNTGAAPKGAFIVRIRPKAKTSDVIAAIEAVGDQRGSDAAGVPFPDGIVEMGATPDVPARRTGTMVFSGRLPAGRYLLLIRAENNGELLPNEYADFTVT
jgi:hypothetical protein